MAHALTLTPELAATIRGARLVGTPLRACAKAAGVPWDTMIGWLRVGRAYNAAEPAKRNPRHVAQAAFAAELDRAGAQCESALHARVMKATEDDGRLALDVLRWNEERGTRQLKRQLVAAQVEVERLRAAGELIDRTDVTSGGQTVAAVVLMPPLDPDGRRNPAEDPVAAEPGSTD